MSTISPQGYTYGEDPKSNNPFWDSSGSRVNSVKAEAEVDNSTGTPSVSVENTGTNADINLKFSFKNLKGEKGDKGDTGETGPAGSPPTVTSTGSSESGAVAGTITGSDGSEIKVYNGAEGARGDISVLPTPFPYLYKMLEGAYLMAISRPGLTSGGAIAFPHTGTFEIGGLTNNTLTFSKDPTDGVVALFSGSVTIKADYTNPVPINDNSVTSGSWDIPLNNFQVQHYNGSFFCYTGVPMASPKITSPDIMKADVTGDYQFDALMAYNKFTPNIPGLYALHLVFTYDADTKLLTISKAILKMPVNESTPVSVTVTMSISSFTEYKKE